jgi:hypothetical protein
MMTRASLARIIFIVSVLALALETSANAQTPTPTPTALKFFAVTPCRVVDTRGPTGTNGGPAMSAGSPRNFQINSLCGVPSTAKAATLNVTFITPTQDGFIKIWPYNTAMPKVSTLNALAGEPAIANGAIVPLTVDPNFNVSVVYGTQFPGTCHLVLDVTGYFQ